MQFVFLIILVKLALVLAAVTLGAMFIAEFFPMMADKALSVSNGTSVEIVGTITAEVLMFFAKYAKMFVDLVFSWLNAFGLNVSSNSIGGEIRNLDIDPPKVEKPKF